MDIKELFKIGIKEEASDLHITVGLPPVLRVDGKLKPLDMPVLKPADTRDMIYGILNEKQIKEFEKNLELDISVSIPGLTRFRLNVHKERGNIEAAFRFVSFKIKSLDDLGLPLIVSELARKPSGGLVLITGPTGVGKSTTLAAMVDQINRERRLLVVTIEDPIEYIHEHKKSIVKQREVYSDTLSFNAALKHVLRQDPDVIVIGEMRDLETIGTALTAAETGHLVLATLHTPDASQTIDRIIDVFPPYQQQQIKIQLAGSIQGIVAQQLLPMKNSVGRVAAVEVLIATPAVRNLIREHQTEQIPTVIQTGAQYGMQTMDRSLKELYKKGIVSYEEVVYRMKDPEEIKEL